MAVRIAALGWVLLGISIPLWMLAPTFWDRGADLTTAVVAAEDIPLGTTITAPMLRTVTVRAADIPANGYATPAEIVGQVTRVSILQGQRITADTFGSVAHGPADRTALAGSAMEAAAASLGVIGWPAFLLAWLIGIRRSHRAAAIGVAIGVVVCVVLGGLALLAVAFGDPAGIVLLLVPPALLVANIAAWRSTSALRESTRPGAVDLAEGAGG